MKHETDTDTIVGFASLRSGLHLHQDHVAVLPSGERVALPAGTVIESATEVCSESPEHQ